MGTGHEALFLVAQVGIADTVAAYFTESNPTFGQKQIDAFKLTDLIRVSVELLQDAEFDLENGTAVSPISATSL